MVAQIGCRRSSASTDLERSREFYEQQNRPDPVLLDDATICCSRCGWPTFSSSPRRRMADHTQVRFWCADVAGDREQARRGSSSTSSSSATSRWLTTCSRRQSAAQRGSKTRMATQSSWSSLPKGAATGIRSRGELALIVRRTCKARDGRAPRDRVRPSASAEVIVRGAPAADNLRACPDPCPLLDCRRPRDRHDQPRRSLRPPTPRSTPRPP